MHLMGRNHLSSQRESFMPETPVDDPALFDDASSQSLRDFFNSHHDKLLCTANRLGEPSIAVMGTPRLLRDGTIDFEISDLVSVTLDNIQQNEAVAFLAYKPGPRARDYSGVRIYARVTQILTHGDKIDTIRRAILEKHGAEKAAELQATVNCAVVKVRPIVDRGQRWDRPAFEDVLDGAGEH